MSVDVSSAVRLPIAVMRDVVTTLCDSRCLKHLTGDQRARLDAVRKELQEVLELNPSPDSGVVAIDERLLSEILQLFAIGQEFFQSLKAAYNSLVGE